MRHLSFALRLQLNLTAPADNGTGREKRYSALNGLDQVHLSQQ